MGSGALLKRALDRAAVLHEGQHRKYPNVKVPYVAHVAGVVAVLARHGFDEEVQAAGALHDVIEDCNVSFDTLAMWFGVRVATLVRDVSEEDKSKTWDERKRAAIERVPRLSPQAATVKAADKLHNLQSLVFELRTQPPHAVWANFRGGREKTLAMSTELVEALARRVEPRVAKSLRAALKSVLDADLAHQPASAR